MKRFFSITLSISLLATLATVSTIRADEAIPEEAESEIAAEENAPVIQVAILLDHSGSMSGLINQAREHLWKIVNEFATLKRDGNPTQLQVALYKYGAGSPELLTALTDDLDKVSEELFAITINGGTENCGQVIQAATRDLKWSNKDADLRCIFIAGNEPFTQGPVDYQEACKEAIAKGITVSTIHCGDHQSGIAGKWQDGALLADGTYVHIDQNQQTVVVNAPQDKLIVEWNTKLNATYIPFGTAQERKSFASNQIAQDGNAAGLNNNAATSRANFKASNGYVCRWDIIDACRLGDVKLKDIKKEQLPKELQKLSTEKLQAHLDKKYKQRQEIQVKIKELNAERNKYVTEKTKELLAEKGDEGANTLDQAIIESVRTQAKRKNYQVTE